MGRLCYFLGIAFDRAILEPYEGRRMTDGVHPQSLPIGDPNFLKHDKIDPSLGEAWKRIRLPHMLADGARRVASVLGFELPMEAKPSSTPAKTNLPISEAHMRESAVDVRGLRLCICAWGPEDGPLVLCLHGILEHGATWEAVAGPLVHRGYRVIAPDLRGHGCSGHVGAGGTYHFVDFLGDLDAIACRVVNRPFILVGHSMGAALAAAFAAVRPAKVAGLVLVECPFQPDRNDGELGEKLRVHLDYLAHSPQHPVFSDVAVAANRLRKGSPSMSEELAMQMAHRLTEQCEGGVRWRWDPLLSTRGGIALSATGLSTSALIATLRGIPAPMRLVFGETSSLASLEDSVQQQIQAASATVTVIHGGHMLHHDAPGALAEIIAEVAASTPELRRQQVST